MSFLWHSSWSSPHTKRTEHSGTTRRTQASLLSSPCPQPNEHVGRLAPRSVIPLVTIALLLVTAGALLLGAATLVPAPRIVSVTPPPVLDINNRSGASRDTTVIQSVEVMPPPAAEAIDLVRIIVEAGSRGVDPLEANVRFLTVESGTLTLDLDGPAHLVATGQPPIQVEGRLRLEMDDGLVWPETTAVTWSNVTRDPVVLLAVGIFPAAESYAPVGIAQDEGETPAMRWTSMIPPGSTLQPLASGWWDSMPAGTLDITLWRGHIPPRTETSGAVMGEVMVVIEAGTASLRIEDGSGWRPSPEQDDQPIIATRAATLLPGDGAILFTSSCVHVRNTGSSPLLLLGLTINPVDQGAQPPSPPAEDSPGLPVCATTASASSEHLSG